MYIRLATGGTLNLNFKLCLSVADDSYITDLRENRGSFFSWFFCRKTSSVAGNGISSSSSASRSASDSSACFRSSPSAPFRKSAFAMIRWADHSTAGRISSRIRWVPDGRLAQVDICTSPLEQLRSPETLIQKDYNLELNFDLK